jgi:hypothetical protein
MWARLHPSWCSLDHKRLRGWALPAIACLQHSRDSLGREAVAEARLRLGRSGVGTEVGGWTAHGTREASQDDPGS